MQERGGRGSRAGVLLLIVPCGRVVDRYSGARIWAEASARPKDRPARRFQWIPAWPVPCFSRNAGSSAPDAGPAVAAAPAFPSRGATGPTAVPERVVDVQFPQPPRDVHGWIRPCYWLIGSPLRSAWPSRVAAARLCGAASSAPADGDCRGPVARSAVAAPG